jgi:hypothetical protein
MENDLTDHQYGPIHRGSSASSRSSFSISDQYEIGGFMKNECIDKTSANGRVINYAYRNSEVTLSGNSKFYFPYDDLTYDSVILLTGTDSPDKGIAREISLAPKVVGVVSAPNWDVTVNVEKSSIDDYPGTRIRIEYKRPLLYRLVVPTLLLLIFGVIITLPFITETSTFVETLIGVVFGLWGLHQVLIPADVTWPTVIDPIILFLYTLLGFVALLRVGIIPVWVKWAK